MSYGNNNLYPIQNPIYNQMLGQQINPNTQMVNNNLQYGTTIMNNNQPAMFNQQMMQQQMIQQQMMQQPMMQPQMGNPRMMNPVMPNQPMPINQPMGNPPQIMNPMTSMQNAQKKAYETYLFYCNVNGLNSLDPNIYSRFFGFFFANNQNNNNNVGQAVGARVENGMSNGVGNNMSNGVGNNMSNGVGSNMSNGVANNMSNGGNNTGNKVANNIYVGRHPGKKLPEIIPRSDKDIYIDDTKNNQTINNIPTVNILFQANTGLKILLPIPRNITIYQMLKRFTDRIGVPEVYINQGLTFLFNGQNMLPFFNNLVGNQFKDAMLITVFDQNGVIGA